MLIKRINKTNAIPGFLLREGKKRGFFGKLWDKIKENAVAVFSTVGAVFGGPVGASIGALIGHWVQENPNIIVSNQAQKTNAITVEQDEYPISDQEENILLAFVKNQFFPALKAISLTLDSEFVTAQKQLQSINQTAGLKINTVNQALREISILKNYALVITQHGELKGKFHGNAKYSDNYIINKVEVFNTFLDQVEKGVFKYMIDNNLKGYTLATSQQKVSNITKVRTVNLNWQGQEVTGAIKQYVKNTDLANNHQPIEVVNTDIDDFNPPTTTEEEQATTKPKSNIIPKALGITAIVLVVREAVKKRKK